MRIVGSVLAAARDRLGRRPAPDGVLWTTISPADVRKLTHLVTELLDEIVTEVEGAR